MTCSFGESLADFYAISSSRQDSKKKFSGIRSFLPLGSWSLEFSNLDLNFGSYTKQIPVYSRILRSADLTVVSKMLKTSFL